MYNSFSSSISMFYTKSRWTVLILSLFLLTGLPFLHAKEITKEGLQRVEKIHLNKYIYKYGVGLQKIDSGNTIQQDDAIFDNDNNLGIFFSGATPTETILDWGTSPGGTVMGFEIGYVTPSTDPVSMTITFYEGTSDADVGTEIASFELTDLPGSESGDLEAWAVPVDISGGSEFELPEGPVGYGYQTADDDGPLFAIGGQGITDAFRILPDEGLSWFGGDPYAQFWMRITGVANEVITPDPPPNDECVTATVANTFPFSDTLDTRGATNNPDDPMMSCNDDGMQTDGNTVWYAFTPDETRTVNFSTIGSNYDTVLGLYTGECGNLTEVECVDIFIDDELFAEVEAGVTYYLKIGEYLGGSGGGTLILNIQEPPPLYQGPDNATVSTGVSVNTDDFTSDKSTRIVSRKQDHNTFKPKQIKRKQPVVQPLGPIGSNFVEDLSASPKQKNNSRINAPYLENGFEGIDDSGFIPPDPIIAAGPEYLMALVNSEIGIVDKNTGELLKLINGDDWYSTILPGSGICDPQVIFDHFSNRWVMLWIECGDLDPTLLISISDDDNPLGDWCNYALPGGVNGDVEEHGYFNDFPKMGLDDKAIYVMSNMFDLDNGGFQYVQIRVIGKAQLYEGTCGGTVEWTDLWDLRDPSTLSTTFTTVPYLAYENTSEAYFVDVEFSNVGTYLNLWTLSDPLGTPSFDAVSVPVTAFTEPGQPDQRGGSSILFEGGSRTIRQPAIYRDGDLWVSRSVGDENSIYARTNYTRIDVATQTAVEDVAFGADGFWYYYPAATVDANKNLYITFTRSGENEYASARYLGRRDSDPVELQTSALLKRGEANYVKDYGSGRNRWGDYNGIAVDPDGQSVWMFTEYAKTPSSTWGTWIGEASFDAPPGAHIVFDPDSINFDPVVIDSTSLPGTITVQNSGQDDLTITDISLSSASINFDLQGLPALPVTLTSFEGFEFSVFFTTDADIRQTNAVVISSNDADNPTVTIPIIGKTPAKVALTQTSFDVTADNSATTSFTFPIENIGGDNLEYEIGFTGVAEFVAPASGARAETGLSKKKSIDLTGLASGTKSKLDLDKPAGLAATNQSIPANALFSYDVSTPANEIYAFAVDFDGTNILVAGGGQNADASDANRLLVYDLNGNLIDEFEQGNDANSAIGWRDMAVVGTTLYGMDQENAQIDEFDLTTGMPTGEAIASPNPGINLRALAYDPATDHFWLSGLGLNIFEIDRQSNVINEYNNTAGLNIRGLGWDSVSPGGPYLWVWADGDPTTQALLFDPVAGEFTDIRFDGDLLGNNVAGGAMFTTELPTNPENTPVFLALHQNVPDFDIVAAYAIPPFWFSGATPNSGFVANGATENIEVGIDVAGYDLGEYKGGVVVGTNDLNQPVSVIEITLTNDFGTSVKSGPVLPSAYSLEQNYPNPFNPETKIRYTIPEQNHVSIIVYNVLGQKVRTLVDKVQIANTHEISWDGRDDDGKVQPTGVYIIRLRSGSYGETIKMLFVK